MAYRVTPKIRARAAEARETIVRAALELLDESGYTATGMHAVASQAGVATGTVYRHFPGKSDLFAEVFRRVCQHEIGLLTETAGGPERQAMDRMADCVEQFARRALEQPTRTWALIAEPVDDEIEAERLLFRRAFRDLMASILRDGARRGELRSQDADLTAAALIGALAEALVGPLRVVDRTTPEVSPPPTDRPSLAGNGAFERDAGLAGHGARERDRGGLAGQGSQERDDEALVSSLVAFAVAGIHVRPRQAVAA